MVPIQIDTAATATASTNIDWRNLIFGKRYTNVCKLDFTKYKREVEKNYFQKFANKKTRSTGMIRMQKKKIVCTDTIIIPLLIYEWKIHYFHSVVGTLNVVAGFVVSLFFIHPKRTRDVKIFSNFLFI